MKTLPLQKLPFDHDSGPSSTYVTPLHHTKPTTMSTVRAEDSTPSAGLPKFKAPATEIGGAFPACIHGQCTFIAQSLQLESQINIPFLSVVDEQAS